MKHPGETPAFRGPKGEPVPGSIAEIAYLPLGGLEQWTMIRGRSSANPALIFLHGGPGFSETRLLRHYNAALEDRFTVVYWDQRGAGKTFDKHTPRSTMTVEQFIADLDELVDHVRRRLGQDRVTIFGHSWGSALGVLYTARFPAKVAAYVGSGQVGDWPAAEAASYEYALELAEQRGATKVLEELRAIGPPPHDAEALWVQRNCLQRLEGKLDLREVWQLGRVFLEGPEYSLVDLPPLFRGFRFSLDAMWAEVSAMDLNVLAPALEVPVFFLLGRRDHWVPARISAAYLEALRAPAKTLVDFERSGHEPFVDEPEAFNAAMFERVLPVVASRG